MRALKVVVVGSGLAGLSCAEALAVSGCDVVVLSAGRPGRDGASHRVASRAPWVLLTTPQGEADVPRFHAELVEKGAGAAYPELAAVLAGEAERAAREIVELLALLPLDEGRTHLPGDAIARGRRYRPALHGQLLELPLARCQRRGVQLVSCRFVVGFGRNGARCTEVLSVDTRDGRLHAEPADAVVLACGGVGALFPVSTEPLWCRGSSLALAALAGASLHRPELTQPLPVLRHGCLFPSSRALLAGRVTADGDELEPASDLLQTTRRIATALRCGSDVRLHPGATATGLPGGVGRGAGAELAIALHHGIGGVTIDSWGRTATPGLYACGEAAGGVQGVRRTMGTGLLEARIFGLRTAAAVACDLDDGLGPGRPAEERRFSLRAARAPDLARRLNDALGPLVAIRPAEEVTRALAWLDGWPEIPPEADASAAPPRSWLEGTRLAAARTLLAGELAETPATASGPEPALSAPPCGLPAC